MAVHNPLDLKQVLRFIVEQKNLQANLILDEGCVLHVEDPKPLIKVLNYLLNYMKQLGNRPLEISLDLMHDEYLVSLLTYTEREDLPELSSNLQPVLDIYHANVELRHEKGKYVQIKIHFKRTATEA